MLEHRRGLRPGGWLVGLLAGVLLAVPGTAAQAYTISSWTAGVYAGDYSGPNDADYYTQAGGHPFEGVTDFTLSTSGSTTKSIRVDVPPGLMSDPQAVPQCTNAQFPSCPASSQLGIVKLTVSLAGVTTYIGASVYNMVPAAGQVSDFAFDTVAGRTDIVGGVRSATDDGLYFTIAVPSTATLISSTLIFWGVPGDSAHQPQVGWSCDSALVDTCTPPASAPTHSLSGKPFITLPSACVPAGQVSTLTVDSYQGAHAQATSTTPVPATGCASVPFDPSLTVSPQTTQSDAPTGVAVDLHVPQSEDPGALASSTLKDAAVTLPPGMTLDPSAANGLAACSPAQFGHGSDAPPTCPVSSQVGTVEIDTPLLAAPLTGSVYLGCDGASPQTPCPARNGLAYLYVYATGQGVTQKLIGTVTADPNTGQLTTTFLNQPQVPFTDFKLDLRGGLGAPLATPLQCGRATTTSSLTPYSGYAAATPQSSFTVTADGGGACAQAIPFSPTLAVTSGTTQAGAFDSPLTFDFTRTDTEQYLGRISAKLPPGLLGLISRVPQCADAPAATGACAATTQIGTASVLAGAGSDPIAQSGPVFLTGPYSGAPFGLSIVVPTVAGPFDLGTVVVRAAIEVDRSTAQVTIASDPLPQVVGGVPLRIRAVAVTIGRSGFIVNPTSCAPLQVTAMLTSTQGATATPASPFQATGCGALTFAPLLRVSLRGRRQTTSGDHPTLTATVQSTLGQANLRAVTVTLPLSLALDPSNSQHVCSVAASVADACPASTRIGSATVDTPLLDAPLTGSVYLVQGIRTGPQGQQIRTLPTLLVTLRGQIALDLRAQTSVDSRGRLVTTFPAVPDAAFSRFTLRIGGGRHGILVVTGRGRSICTGVQSAWSVLDAQSGAARARAVAISTPCPDRVRIDSTRVRGRTVRLRVTVPGAGRVLIGGSGLRTVRRSARRRNTISVVLRLTPRAAHRLRRAHRLTTRVVVRYSRRHHRTQTARTGRLTLRLHARHGSRRR